MLRREGSPCGQRFPFGHWPLSSRISCGPLRTCGPCRSFCHFLPVAQGSNPPRKPAFCQNRCVCRLDPHSTLTLASVVPVFGVNWSDLPSFTTGDVASITNLSSQISIEPCKKWWVGGKWTWTLADACATCPFELPRASPYQNPSRIYSKVVKSGFCSVYIAKFMLNGDKNFFLLIIVGYLKDGEMKRKSIVRSYTVMGNPLPSVARSYILEVHRRKQMLLIAPTRFVSAGSCQRARRVGGE